MANTRSSSSRRSARSRKPVEKYGDFQGASSADKSSGSGAENNARVQNARRNRAVRSPKVRMEKTKKRPAEDRQSNASPQKKARSSTLFDAISDKNSAILPQVRNILTMARQDASAASAALHELLLRAGGSTHQFEPVDINDDNAVDEELHKHAASVIESEGECLLGDTSKSGAVFSRRFGRFWQDLVKEGGVDISCDSSLVTDIMDFLGTMSCSKLGSFRFVAVSTTMLMGDEIISLHSAEEATFEKIQRQFKAETKKRKKRRASSASIPNLELAIAACVGDDEEEDEDNLEKVLDAWTKKHSDAKDARLIQLGRMAASMALKIRALRSHINYAFDSVVKNRYRDVHSPIRAECISGFGRWIEAAPRIFRSEKYTRYLGWTLYDKDERVRETSLKAIRRIMAGCTTPSPMRKFATRFKSRISDVFLDPSPRVVVAAFDVVEQLLRLGLVGEEDLEEEEKDTSISYRATGCLFTRVRSGSARAPVPQRSWLQRGFQNFLRTIGSRRQKSRR